MAKRNIGMWLYQNSGGEQIQKKMIKKLKERDIDVIANINLKDAIAKNGHIIYEMKDKKVKLDKRISRSPKGLLFLDYPSIERRKRER